MRYRCQVCDAEAALILTRANAEIPADINGRDVVVAPWIHLESYVRTPVLHVVRHVPHDSAVHTSHVELQLSIILLMNDFGLFEGGKKPCLAANTVEIHFDDHEVAH